MLQSAPSLLVFDLDGTLIDSSMDLCLSVNAALRHVGANELSHDQIAGFIGDGAATLVRRALSGSPAHSTTEQPAEQEVEAQFARAFPHFLAFYREHKLDHTQLYDGVRPALERLRQDHSTALMAVLTNKPVGPAVEICRGLGIDRFFFRIYGGDSFASKKPDPAGLRSLMREAQGERNGAATSPEASLHPGSVVHPGATGRPGAVMIGDSAVDVLTARRAGIHSLGCRYGLDPEAMQLAGPDMLCDHPSEWPQLLS